MKRKKIIRSSLFYAGLTVAGAALIWGSIFADNYSPIISLYFNQPTYEVQQNDSEEVENIYKSEFSSSRALIRNQKKYAETIQAEGSVLLRNENNTLPLTSVSKITLLGTSAVDFLYGGSGAGSISTLGVPNLKEAFENYDIDVNDSVWDLYVSGAGKDYRRNASITYTVGEAPVSIFTPDVKSTFASYSDAAVVVIGRTGMEGGDLARTTTEDAKKHSLQLSQNEIDTIKLAKNSGFKKVIVILNTLNAMELNELDDLGVDACLWVGAGGQFGINAIPKMIKGDLYPSGKLVDTYAVDALSAPAMQNYGDYTFSNISAKNWSKYVTYNEGIYVGYKYYETRYEDAVLNQGSAGTFNYTEQVQYPFGYGLSYSTFETTKMSKKENDTSFDFIVTIKNTGSRIGKDVAEIYMQSPYTSYDKTNGIEKSSVKLVGFAKTIELKPGESDTVTIKVNKEELASYDSNNKKTYVVDEGNYYFAAGSSAHDALNNILAAKGKTIANGMDYNGDSSLVSTYNVAAFDSTTYSKSVSTDEEITNQFDNANLSKYDSSVKYLSRNNWTGTFPKTYENSEGSRKNTAAQALVDRLVLPTVEDKSSEYTMPVTNTVDATTGRLSLVNMNGLPYDSEYWDILLNQMTAEELYTLARIGGYSTQAITSINKPATIDKDGPAGISSTLVGGKGAFGYPVESVISSSWNVEIAKRVGELIGEDGLYTKTSGWYAPSMNIHRTQFSGRNFEYFSEDGVISGLFGAAMVEGCQSKGLYPYIKHFAFNDQETNRGGVSTFMNEQTAREIYLKPFEITVRNGKAMGVMAAMNRIGTEWVGHSKELMTNILRDEWGFRGMVITDQASFFTDYIGDFRPTLVAGVDLMLCTKSNLWEIDNYQSNAMYMTYLRNAAHNILYPIANSNAMNGQSSSTKIVKIMPVWERWMVGADVVLGLAIITGLVLNTLSLLKTLKEKEA